MPVIVQTVTSKVSALWGKSYIRDANGKFRLLQLEEVVVRGDMILTEQNAIVQLSEDLKADASPAAPRVAYARAPVDNDVDRAIAGLERGELGFAPAAGTSAGDGGLTPATVVERVVEVAPAGLPAQPLPVVLPTFGEASPVPAAPSVAVAPPVGARLGVQRMDGDEVTEGQALVFSVLLSAATTQPVNLPFALAFNSAESKDIGTPLFSNGVVLNADGTLTVPAGVPGFAITVPTVDDRLLEQPETITLTLDGVQATGQVNDNDQPGITSVEPGEPGADGDAVVEGNRLVYTVSLSQPSSTGSLYPFSLGGAAGQGNADTTDHGAPTFSDGVVLNADGTLTVPSGVTRFTISVPTVDDSAVEPSERLPLSVGGITGLATILDNDGGGPRVDTVLPGPPGLPDDTTPEGAPLAFTVTLSGPTTEPTTFPFQLGGGTAGAEDIGTPAFTGGVTLNPDGTITVPAGVIAFTVTVPTAQDSLVEGNETVPLSVGGVSATGTVIDDDAGTPTVTQVEPGRLGLGDDATPEGTVLSFAVSLSGPTAVATRYPFSLGGGTAAAGDFGAPVFTDGVALNSDGTITVPAGVSSFSVNVPTTQDTLVEANEQLPLTIGGVLATGTIIDDDSGPPVVVSVEPGEPGVADDGVPEGDDLRFTVTLNEAAATPTTHAFALGGGTAGSTDFGNPSFSDGVALNPDGTITVPAGVLSFSVTVPTTQDTQVESDETVPLMVGGKSATGTIADDDGSPTITTIEPGMPGPADNSTPEGTDLLFTVGLSEPTTRPATYPFSMGGGTAGAADHGTPVFSNGVTLNPDGTITVPAGVAGFTVTVPTTQDTLTEADETVPLSIGGVQATGTIVDDDFGKPTVTRVEPGEPGLADNATPEGANLVYTVSLSGTTVAPSVYAFNLGGGTAGASDIGAPVFSDGVTLNPDGTVTVPAGVAGFTVTVPTTQDSLVETNETVPLAVGGVSATGSIIDDDGGKPSITSIEPGQPGLADDAAPEGTVLQYQVTLSATTSQPATYTFALGGGSAAASDFGAPLFSDGVVLNADGTITVPAGVAGFTVSVPTVQDSSVEPDETVPLSIGGKAATGSIIDDDGGQPPITTVEPGQPGAGDDKVTEGGTLVYTVTLGGAPATPATYSFALGGGTAGAGDVGAPAFSDGVVLNTDGTITVPAGVTRFTVSVPTTQDTAVEPDESLPLTVGGVAATGTIVDDDSNKPTITHIEPGTPGPADDAVAEGTALVFNVALSAPTTAPVNYPFTLGGGTATNADFGAPAFSNGVTLDPDGSITVPAGVSSFSVTVPTTQDTTDEPDESVPLSIGGVQATGTVIDDDAPPSIQSVTADPNASSVTEGGTLAYTVTLSGPSPSSSVFAFMLGGGTATAGDFGAPVFSDGVTLLPSGVVVVPPGVTSFSVRVPTFQDLNVEATETVPLSIGGVRAVGNILDDDGGGPGTPPTVISVEPGSPGTSDDRTPEGNNLVYTVSLSGTTTATTSLSFALGGGTASNTDLGAPSFSNGVTLNADGTLSVPAGVSSFSVVVPTVQDSTDEPDETVPLRVGGVGGTGTIVDDDATPTITRVEPGNPGVGDDAVLEGTPLVYTVSLSNPSHTAASFAFVLGGGTSSAGDIGSPVFSNGVTLESNGTLSVPAGVTSFTVTVPTVQDTLSEPSETVPLRIGGVLATGTIVDNDSTPPTITGMEPGRPGVGDDHVVEGSTLVYAVTMSGPSDTAISYPFTLGGGTAGAGDIGAPVFSNGVVLNANGTITVPAGISSFTVNVPTVQDTLGEPDETVPLSIGGVSALGGITDDDGTPGIDKVTAQPGNDTVSEGQNLVFSVGLTHGAALPTTHTFSLGGGSASAGDVGAPVFSNGVVLNADGTITVPAFVTSFTVTVPTTQDSLQEANETVLLNVGGITGTGTIVDDDFNRAPLVGSVSASVSEEGLAGGIKDNTGAPTDTGDASTVTGRISISDPDGQALTTPVLTAPTAALSSGGVPITWQGSGTGMLTASAGGVTVATAQIDASGNYSFSLIKPIDHATGQGENVQRLEIGVSASDGKSTGSGTLSIQIEDDAPVAADITTVLTPAASNTNVMVVLDVSGSMKEASGIDGLTRLQAAVQSIKTLLDRYDAQGDVAVRLVTFGAQGQALGDTWTTVDQAKLLLSRVQASSGTNYDDALADAIAAFGSPGRIAGANNVSYFLSDGEPNTGSGSSTTLSGSTNTSSGDAGIQAAEAQQWTRFLDTNGVQSHALAVGAGASAGPLAAIAYDGQSHTSGTPLLVSSFSDLPQVLLSTTAASSASGTLFGSGAVAGLGAGLGADGGHVQSFMVDGVNYSFNPAASAGAGAVTASSVHAFSFDAGSKTLVVDTAAGGRFTVDLDGGGYTYRAAPTAAAGFTERFSYSLVDSDGDTASATGQVQIGGPVAPPPPPPPPTNQAPVVTSTVATVSEEGLAGGLADSTGSQGDKTNQASTSGRISISDPEGQAISSVVLTAPTEPLTSGGQAVTWVGSGTQALTASAGGQVVATACIDNQGNYCFKLLKAVDHTNGNGENLKTLDIGVSASDGSRSGSGRLSVNIEDDAPQVGNASSSLQGVNTNVMVVLDTSGSMGQAAPGLGMTRLQAAIKSIETLLDRYDAQGDVAVRLVGFSSEGKALGNCWTTVSQAKSLMATLKACGATNYDDALADAIAAFGSAGKIAGAQNVSYFLSDGNPTMGSGGIALAGGSESSGSDTGIQAAEEKSWTTFLASNRVNSFALGMGSDITDASALHPVAYDGRSQTNTAATVVSSYADLGTVLGNTTSGVACGKLFGAATAGSGLLGADAGHVNSFSVDGVTYTFHPEGNNGAGSVSSSTTHAFNFNASTQTLNVTTAAGGQFFVDMDGGGYSYRASAQAPAGFAEKFNFTLVDNDGDLAGGSGTVSTGGQPATPSTAAQMLEGSSGADHLQGGGGNDVLDGGAGSDHLFGGFGNDVFKWDLADRGTPGAPAIDTVHDFDLSPTASGGDMLDLRDLLGGALQAGGADKLAQYLDIDTQSQPGSTVLHISTQGGFADGEFKASAEDQRIVLDGVNLRDALSLGAGASEDQMLQELIHRNKIETGL